MSSFQYIRIKLENSNRFIDPGLSYRHGNTCSLVVRYDNPMRELTLSPPSEFINSTTVGGGFRPHLFLHTTGAWSDI
jgi:hypothetical protein